MKKKPVDFINFKLNSLSKFPSPNNFIFYMIARRPFLVRIIWGTIWESFAVYRQSLCRVLEPTKHKVCIISLKEYRARIAESFIKASAIIVR